MPYAIKWVLLYALSALSGILCLRILQRERADDGSKVSVQVADGVGTAAIGYTWASSAKAMGVDVNGEQGL